MIDLLKTAQAVITDILNEASGIKTFALKLSGPVCFKPGQFVLISLMGAGESAFALSSLPGQTDEVQVTIQKRGKHTGEIHKLTVGDTLHFRGPYGNHFPVEQWQGSSLLLVAGGIGLAPLRPVIYTLLQNPEKYKRITILYGAKTEEGLIYRKELDAWSGKSRLVLTLDKAEAGWQGKTGTVPDCLEELGITVPDTIALICGPPVMIKKSISCLQEMGFGKKQIYTTLEMKMKCGVGICGRCNIDNRYICKDGPVFSADTISV